MDQVLPLPLTLRVPCRAAPGARSSPHEVVIEPDWSVRTGHDAELERIAAAFGGGVSCLPLLANTLPAFRAWREHARRASGLSIQSANWGATWSPPERFAGCCPPTPFRDPGSAAAHCREPRHVAAGVPGLAKDLRTLVKGLGPRADPAMPTDVGLGPAGSDELAAAAWQCGLSPAWVAEVRTQMSDAGVIDVELEVLLAIASSGADPAWVATTGHDLSERAEEAALPRASPLAWIAWTTTDLDREQPTVRAQWLARGVRPADLVTLSRAGYPPSVAVALANDWGVSVPGAAQILTRWVELGYRPTHEALGSLREAGLSYPPWPPAREAVTRAIHGLKAHGVRIRSAASHAQDPREAAPQPVNGPAPGNHTPTSPTDVALALLRWGTVADTVAALTRAHRESLTAGGIGQKGA